MLVKTDVMSESAVVPCWALAQLPQLWMLLGCHNLSHLRPALLCRNRCRVQNLIMALTSTSLLSLIMARTAGTFLTRPLLLLVALRRWRFLLVKIYSSRLLTDLRVSDSCWLINGQLDLLLAVPEPGPGLLQGWPSSFAEV